MSLKKNIEELCVMNFEEFQMNYKRTCKKNTSSVTKCMFLSTQDYKNTKLTDTGMMTLTSQLEKKT